MLESIIAILISMNLQFNVIDEKSLNLSSESFSQLQANDLFVSEVNNGTIHDLTIVPDENKLYDLVIVPDVDPINNENK